MPPLKNRESDAPEQGENGHLPSLMHKITSYSLWLISPQPTYARFQSGA